MGGAFATPLLVMTSPVTFGDVAQLSVAAGSLTITSPPPHVEYLAGCVLVNVGGVRSELQPGLAETVIGVLNTFTVAFVAVVPGAAVITMV
jgi:hypothetical protein